MRGNGGLAQQEQLLQGLSAACACTAGALKDGGCLEEMKGRVKLI